MKCVKCGGVRAGQSELTVEDGGKPGGQSACGDHHQWEHRLWILGASDPEMAAIERLLTDAQETVAYAVGPDGSRVHPGNAYRAIGYRVVAADDLSTRWDGPCFLVECGGDLPPQATVVDHHRPGDPGYGRPPEEFAEASSLGQVAKIVGHLPHWGGTVSVRARPHGYDAGAIVVAPDSEEYGGECFIVPRGAWVAAADHCLEAAYRGRCPGVDPDSLMRWRAESRTAFQRRPVASVLADVEAARKRLREAVDTARSLYYSDESGQSHHVAEWQTCVADLRGESIPELPEAAAREGIPFVADQTDRDGRRKVVLMAAPEHLVRRFLAGDIVPGLIEMYGDPARGFAGGYIA